MTNANDSGKKGDRKLLYVQCPFIYFDKKAFLEILSPSPFAVESSQVTGIVIKDEFIFIYFLPIFLTGVNDFDLQTMSIHIRYVTINLRPTNKL